jgi:hypothetical protein
LISRLSLIICSRRRLRGLWGLYCMHDGRQRGKRMQCWVAGFLSSALRPVPSTANSDRAAPAT